MRESPRGFGVHKNTGGIDIHTSEIVVAERAQEPYILAFRYRGENIASTALGELVGFFEIEQHDQDAAYIVNFLASVAKKEYFANPRRPAGESFEAALHRINVALSELVKHGNVSWLGHVSGVVAAFVGNTLHFSVTGDGALLLWRAGTLRTISEGLVETGAEPHPLKTFVEIASGELFAGDRFFICSPSLWTLFTPVDIEKALARFTSEAFQQFLRTALVNELRSAIVLSIDCDAGAAPLPAPRTSKSGKRPVNAFSEATFRASLPPTPVPQAQSQIAELKADFTDKKTGHIYVQGQDIALPQAGRWGKVAHNWHRATTFWHGSQARFRRSLRRLSKGLLRGLQSIAPLWTRSVESGRHAGARGTRRLRQVWRQGIAAYRARQKPAAASLPRPQTQREIAPVQDNSRPAPAALLASSSQRIFALTKRSALSVMRNMWHGATASSLQIKIWWIQCSRRARIGFGIGSFVLLIALVTWLAVSKKASIPATPPVATPPQLSVETEAARLAALPELSNPETLLVLPAGERVVKLAFLGDTAYLVTERALLNLSTGERFPAPKPLRSATAMRDLQAFFCLTQSTSLLMFTPKNGTFTESTLPLPPAATATSLGSFLTYLYVLDAKNAAIYRFPRSESGFGTPTTWLKESRVFDGDAQILVSDALFVQSGNTIARLERGRTTVPAFESPPEAARLSDFAVSSDGQSVFALDTLGKHLLRWSSDGKFSAALAWDSSLNPEFLAISPDARSVLLTSDGQVLRFTLPASNP